MSQTAPALASRAQTRRKRDEYVTAMAEDLAEWMSHLLPDLAGDLKGDNFFDKISDGILLCQYANQLHQRMIDSGSGSKLRGGQRLQGVRVASVNAFLPNEPPKYQSRGVRPRYRGGVPFWIRENVASFLKWCRAVGFPDSILFETEDLVSRRHLRSVIICLLEVARLGGKFGMEVPKIIHLEKQIDAELAAERRGLPKPEQKIEPSTPNNNSPSLDMHSADEAVQEMLAACTCNPPFSMVRVSEGRYVFGGSDTPMFIRLLRGQVMVRVDDDWDTLKHFLQQHDECRKVTLQDSLAEESPADWTESPFQPETPKEFTFKELDQEPDNPELTATDQSLINPTVVLSQREMPKKFTFQELDSDLIDLRPTPTDRSPINPTMVSVQRETLKEVMPQDLDSDLIDLRPTPTDQSPISLTTVSVQRETPNEFMPQDLDSDLIDLRPTPTGQSPVNPTTVSLQRDTPKECMPDVSGSDLDDLKPTSTDQSLVNPTTVSLQRETPKKFMPDVSGSDLDDLKPTPTDQSIVNPTTVSLQRETPKEIMPDVSGSDLDDREPTRTGQSFADPMTNPLQLEPPKEFTPQVLDPEPDDLKPSPTAYLAELGENRAIYQDDNSFKTLEPVDEYALLVAQQQQDSFKQLIWQLIYARNITSELERARAIFLWLCTKDLNKMKFDKVKSGSPEETLLEIHMGKSSYAEAFQTLCRYADLHCKLIPGYAKYRDYSPRTPLSGSDQEYSWNAVLIDGTWRLVDCNWAARYSFKKGAKVRELTYDINTFYFLTDPGQFIYSHFPHDTDWQLLHNPITLEEFESFAFVLSPFFKYNLSLLTHRNGVVEFTDPEIRIDVGFPRGSEDFLFFDTELKFDDQDFTEHYNKVPLMRYARHEVLEKDSRLAVYVRPPKPGAYILSIYVNPTQRELAIASDAAETADNQYTKVCEYHLTAKVSPQACLPPFPHDRSGEYGKTENAKRFNIRAVCREPTVRANQGSVELHFISINSSRPLPRLMGELKSTLLSADAMKRCILQRPLWNSTEFVFSIFLPDAGEYALNIFANDPQRDGDSYLMIWRYRLTADSASPVRGLPSLPPDYLGPCPKFAELGLSTMSHSDPFIRADTDELCIRLAYQQNMQLKWSAKFIFVKNDSSEDCSHLIRQEMHRKQVCFFLRFPHTGFFKLQLYALPVKDRKHSLPSVYNYLIEAI